jgi:hypothetical protein
MRLLATYLALVTVGLNAEAETPTASAPMESGALLKAINFALDGVDATSWHFTDRAQCIVERTQPTGKNAVKTFFLNNIDAKRTKFELHTSDKEAERFMRVQLYGEQAIVAPQAVNHFSLDVRTDERERLMRAWKYIYENGCTSAKSSF